MGRNVEIQEQVNVHWTCDNCGDPIADPRPPKRRRGPQPQPPKCHCGRYLCKHCKRNVHLSIGSGNGLQVPYQISDTKVWCPSCLALTVKPLFQLLSIQHNAPQQQTAVSTVPTEEGDLA